ncbi:MAG: ABC transporter substrate-binding protein [Sphaerochaetaceae bacterium]|nr:ABC transporter substrate-binding protein [Sphaerochaetaceae bacterium]
MKKLSTVLLVLCLCLSVFAQAASEAAPAAKSAAPAAEAPAAPVVEAKPTVVEFKGDYVFKDSVSTMAANWNPHTYETSDDAYPVDSAYIRLGLYNIIFNDEIHPVEGKDPFKGYVVIPEMAAALPVDVTEEVKASHPEYNIPADAKASYAYKIDLNPKAVWENGVAINADTYVYSMEKLLDSKLLNYRATDYYAQEFAIAGAEGFANSGRTIKKTNSLDGENCDYQIADLVKGADGSYATKEGYKAYFGLTDANYGWMSGNTLTSYAKYFPEGVLAALQAMADEKGYVPVTDESLATLFKFTNSDNWGNETWEQLAFYLSYDFTYPTVDFSTVGIYKTGEYQIVLVLAKPLAGFNLLYSLTSNWIVYKDLYEACLKESNGVWTSTYNTSVETTLSFGPYKLVEFQADKFMKFVRNESWYGYTDGQHIYVDPTDGKTYPMYQTTSIECQVVAESSTRKLMFLKGELMQYGLQADDFATYRNSDYCYATPAETIYFLILNGYADAINQREGAADFDKAKVDLQCLLIPEFRKAVAVTYDKELFASTVSPARSGGYGIIGIAYVYDPETGSLYRDTPQAKQVLCDFYSVNVADYASLDDAVASITGFDPVAAKALFIEAFAKALEAGYVTDADNDGKSDQTVTITYSMSSDSDFMTRTIDYLNEKMAEVTAGTPFEGRIKFVKSAPLGNAWSTNIKNGMTDTVLGGWSGSALNPFGLTDLYVNPSYQYDAKWFDATKVILTKTINGEEITMNLRQWSDALNSKDVVINDKTYNFGDGIADIETRLEILAAIEGKVLTTYNYIPMLQNAGMSLLSQQVYWVIEEYNPVMIRGGIPYLKYNYDEAGWKSYVATNGGELKY